jgi:oligogalacturonide transport system substrate-binding protein
MYKKLVDSHVMPDTKYYASFGKSNMYEMKPWIQGEWAEPICGTPPLTNIPTT